MESTSVFNVLLLVVQNILTIKNSLVLMACCDTNYCFTWVEVGDYDKIRPKNLWQWSKFWDKIYLFFVNLVSIGSLPDSSIFANSQLGAALETSSLNLPPPKELPGTNEKISHFFVGDEAFPLRTNLMRPYSRKDIKSDRERIFNYRLSRARRIIENTFGIFSSRYYFHQNSKIFFYKMMTKY